MVIVISLTEMALTWYDVRHEPNFFLTVGVLGGAIWGASAKVVDVSRVDPHYFETADGRTFVPVVDYQKFLITDIIRNPALSGISDAA